MIGTWFWLYCVVLVCQHLLNSKFNKRWYNLIIGSSMYIYVSHYFWIVLVANMFLKAKLNQWWNAFLLIFFAELFMFLTYSSVTWTIDKIRNKRNQ